ncbi:MAG: ABC transporter permease [Pseudomonadota bacterium]
MSSVIVIKRNTLEIWRDVIFALFAREIRTGFNDKLGLSWAIIQPVAFIFILSYLRSSISGRDTHSLETFTFMAIGILFIQSFLQTVAKSAMSIRKNKALFAFRQVQPISAVIAASLFEFLVKIVSIVGIVVIMYFFKMDIYIGDGLLFIACFSFLLLLATSIGLIFGIVEMFVTEISKVREIFTRPLFFISGTFFSLQDIPTEYWPYLTWNPILHSIELARFAVSTPYGDDGVSLSYLVISTLVAFFSAFAIYLVFWKQAISR